MPSAAREDALLFARFLTEKTELILQVLTLGLSPACSAAYDQCMSVMPYCGQKETNQTPREASLCSP